jgi:hypothetical protein
MTWPASTAEACPVPQAKQSTRFRMRRLPAEVFREIGAGDEIEPPA